MLIVVLFLFIVLQILIINWTYSRYDDCLDPKVKDRALAMLVLLTYLYTIFITEWRL